MNASIELRHRHRSALGRVGGALKAQFDILRASTSGLVGLTVVVFFALVAIFAPWLAPHGAWDTLIDRATGHLAMLMPPSRQYPLGTTALGRDLLSQMIYATRTTMLIGVVSGAASILIGANVGLISGYFGGRVDEALMRFTDVVYGMPFLPFIIVLISLFGRSKWFVMLAIVLIVWRTSARVIRAQTLSIKSRQFVQAAKVRGCSDLRIIYRHILPNVMPLLLLYTAFNIAWSVIAEAGASFLGFGDPNQLSWGGMLYQMWISGDMRVAWWWFAWPSLAIVMLVSSLVFVSRAYEEVANPRLKGR